MSRPVWQLGTVATVLAVGWMTAATQAQLGTAFTYQGELKKAGEPVTEICHFEFSLWDDEFAGGQIGATQYLLDVEVQDGLFTVLLNAGGEFGATPFDGQPRWLEITVTVPPDDPETLSPRQPVTPTPHTFYAESAPWDGLVGVPDDFADGVDNDTTYEFGEGLEWDGLMLSLDPDYMLPQACADGQVPKWNSVTDLWECADDDTGAGAFWSLAGNSGTLPGTNFLGTTDQTALELHVNALRALRVEPDTVGAGVNGPNIIGGHVANLVEVGVHSATIAGGGTSALLHRIMDSAGTIGGGHANQAGDDNADPDNATLATVGGGAYNQAMAFCATIAGGGPSNPNDPANTNNRVYDAYGTIGGGTDNRVGTDNGDPNDAWGATIAGGRSNRASESHAFVGGGIYNQATADYATVGGGQFNEASNWYAAIAGGGSNMAGGHAAAIAGGQFNTVSGTYGTVAGGRNNEVTAWCSAVGGGWNNSVKAKYATIAGGGPSDPNDPNNTNNRIYDDYGTIGGGGRNRAGSDDANPDTAEYATVAGGYGNTAGALGATVAGGRGNLADYESATVGGGYYNGARADHATVGGGTGNTANGQVSTIAGGQANSITNAHAAIGGGSHNTVNGAYGTIAGGGPSDPNDPTNTNNQVYDKYGTIAGGGCNRAGSNDLDPTSTPYTTVGGGWGNAASGEYTTLGGGAGNSASGPYATVGGGGINSAYGDSATIGGGAFNTTNGAIATVAGGQENEATFEQTTVSGGWTNRATHIAATVSGGQFNAASDDGATVGGGAQNRAGSDPNDPNAPAAFWATVGGGASNTASGDYGSTVAGGWFNTASGYAAMVPGGSTNIAEGNYSFAAGQKAWARHNGAFVWADSTDPANYLESVGNDTFNVRATGGIYAEADNAAYSARFENDGNGDGVRAYGNVSNGNNWAALYAHNTGTSPGIYAYSSAGYAAYLDGDIYVNGEIQGPVKPFKIDHPLDPENKYLMHCAVESPDIKNVYDGVATLDVRGAALVELPEWFEALNRDFRYQLTAIGAPGPNLYVAQEIKDNRFKIAGGKPGMKVSWQVTGIRQDAYANANRIQVEVDKPEEERGTYLHPQAHGMPEEMGLGYEVRQAKLSRLDHSESPSDMED